MGIDIAAVAAAAARSVVGVEDGRRRGSGFVIGDGLVLTTAHNVRGGTPGVSFADGRLAEGRVSAASGEEDLAVVAVDTADVPALTWGDPGGLVVGSEVVAVAAPDGLPRTTAGAVARTGGRFHTASGSPVAGVIDHTAPMARGSSGGPLLDGQGMLVGVNANRVGGGLYQAVPADQHLRRLVDALAAGTVPSPRRLGVVVHDRHRAAQLRRAVGLPPRAGVLLAQVTDGSPAASAGLAQGDLVVSIDGHDLSTPDDLLIALRSAGRTAQLRAVRGADAERTVTVELEQPTPA